MTIIFDPIDILCKSIFEQFIHSLSCSHTFIRQQVFAFVSIDHRIKYMFDYVRSDNDEMGERIYIYRCLCSVYV